MTTKMHALFKKHPPKQPLTSLEAIIEDWHYRFGTNGLQKHRRDTVCAFCAEAPDLATAIARACAARAPNGKMHVHQFRVPAKSRQQLAESLCAAVQNVTSFDELYDITDRVKPFGIGPVTVYDVATRIAAFLNLEVQSLYLHAGVLDGWNILHGTKGRGELRIAHDKLPIALQQLPADEIEDMLCAYREFWRPWLQT